MELLNKVIIVTGGAGDLGLDIVEKLTNAGAIVYTFDIKEGNGENYVKVDLLNEADVKRQVDTVVSKHKKIDVLINNAGAIYSEPLINILNPDASRHSYQNFKKYLELNLDTTFIISSIVAEKMVKKRTKGVIINMSSISATGNAGQSAYSAAKGGIESLTKTWSKELGVFGIRTIAIAPGFIQTPSTNKALNETIISYLKKNTPLRKLGSVGNISDTIIFAIENEFLNGAVLPVDGGLKI